MSGEEKNKLDELFKNGLGEPTANTEYIDQDWDGLEHLLDAGKKARGMVFWLPRMGAVAAILILFLGWWLLQPAKVNHQQVVSGVKHFPVKQTPMGDAIDHQLNIANNVGDHKANAPYNPAKKQNVTLTANHAYGISKSVTSKNGGASKAAGGIGQTNDLGITPVNSNNQALAVATDAAKVNTVVSEYRASAIAQTNSMATVNADTGSRVDPTALTAQKANADILVATDVKPKNTKLKVLGNGPRFGVAIMISPDVNGVGSFQNAKVGLNASLVLSVGITKRLTISTGAAYSKKPYMTDFANYYAGYKFKTDPANVSADCRVLDIPLNVDYKVYSRSKNSFSLGTGLSSYFMLSEKYTYNYDYAGTSGPTGVAYYNRNKHLLGVLNLNATYEHKVNSKFSMAAQPYLKVPLTDIGNSRVKLQSAGVAVGLRWNINKSITP